MEKVCSSAASQPVKNQGGITLFKINIPLRSKFGLRLRYIQSRRIDFSLLPFFPPHNRDGDIIPMRPRIRSGDTHHPPQLVTVRSTKRVPDKMSARIIINESPSALREFSSFGFAFYRCGASGRRDEFGQIGFGYRAFETGEVTSD